MPLDVYNKSRDEFNRGKSLPFYHIDRIFTMADWLKCYQMCDVVPLVDAVKNQFRKFNELFGIDSNCYNSLPAIARVAMFENYDQSMPYGFSFHKKNDAERKDFRDNIIAGLTTCPHRHVDLSGDASSPHNARHVPNGDPISAASFQDLNR